MVVGNKEVIYTAAQRTALGLNYWPDGNLGVIPDGNGSYYFYAANGSVAKRAHGSLTVPGQMGTANCSMTGGETFNYKAGGPIYRDPASGRLLLFYHAEVHPGGDGTKFYSVLGMGISEGAWTSFYDCGRTVQANMSQEQADAMGRIVEMAGTPYIVKDGYFWVYYRDLLADGSSVNLCVARALVADVVAAATNHTSAPWQKYYNGAFSEPGLGGLSSPLEAGNPVVRWMDIKWNTYLRKYVMVLAGAGAYTDLYIMFSDDGLNWSARTQIEVEPGESFYPSLVGTGVDPLELGKSFYVYYTYSVAGGWDRWSDAQLARRLITIDDGSPTNNFPHILLIGDSNTEIGHIYGGLRDALAADYGPGGTGYRSCNEDKLGVSPAGFSLDNDANWQKFDMYGSARLTPPHPAPDGNWAESATVGATTTIRFAGTALDLYWRAQPGGGTFSVAMDGVAITNIATAGAETACRAWRGDTLANGLHTAVVAVVSGNVALLGVDVRVETNGPLWRAAAHKWGNGSASTVDYQNVETNVLRSALKELSPDVVAILLGTNDHNIDGLSAAAFKANLIALMTRITNAVPGVNVMLVSTFETGTAPARTLLPQYLATSYPEAAAATGAEYWDMSTWFGPYDANRMLDPYHVNAVYGAQIGAEMYNQIKTRIISPTAPTNPVSADISVANFSFASPDVPNPGSYISDNVTGWVCMTGGGSRQGVNNQMADPRVPSDDQQAFLNYAQGTGGGLSQNPGGHKILANRLYVLTTAVRAVAVSQFQIALRASSNTGTILASTTLTSGYGSWQDVVISFNSKDMPGLVGKPLHIVYKVLAGTADWQTVTIDNVRLSCVPASPTVMMAAASVQPHATAGTVLGSVRARNPDGGAVTYAKVIGRDSDRFAIDPGTGVVTLGAPAGAVGETYYLDVTATGATTATLAIAVTVEANAVPGISITAVELSGATLQLSAAGASGRPPTVWFTTNLIQGDWQPKPDLIWQYSNGFYRLSFDRGASRQEFYRMASTNEP
jgi:hypothetical protein